MARYRFLLEGGMHMDEYGNIYNNGDVVESDKDLRKTISNKFKLLIGEGTPEVDKKELDEDMKQMQHDLSERRKARLEEDEDEVPLKTRQRSAKKKKTKAVRRRRDEDEDEEPKARRRKTARSSEQGKRKKSKVRR